MAPSMESFGSFLSSLAGIFGGNKRKRSEEAPCEHEPVITKLRTTQPAVAEAENSTYATKKRNLKPNLESIHSPLGKQDNRVETKCVESNTRPRLRQIDGEFRATKGYGQARLGQTAKIKHASSQHPFKNLPNHNKSTKLPMSNGKQKKLQFDSPEPRKTLQFEVPSSTDPQPGTSPVVSPFIRKDNAKLHAFEKLEHANLKEREAAKLRAEGRVELCGASVDSAILRFDNGVDNQSLQDYQSLLATSKEHGREPFSLRKKQNWPVGPATTQLQKFRENAENGGSSRSLTMGVLTAIAFQNLEDSKSREDFQKTKEAAEAAMQASLQTLDLSDKLVQKTDRILKDQIPQQSKDSLAQAETLHEEMRAQMRRHEQFYRSGLEPALKQPAPQPPPPAAKPQQQQHTQPKHPKDDAVILLSSDDEEEAAAEEPYGSAYAEEYSEQERDEAGEESEEEGEEEEEEEEEEYSDEELQADLRGRVEELHVAPAEFSDKDVARIKNVLHIHHKLDEIIVRHVRSNIDLSRGHLQCLDKRQWLNDEVINVYMSLLQERDMRWRGKTKAPKCHFFNSFFINKLYRDQEKYDYSAVSRWTRPKRLESSGQLSPSVVDVDHIICPVHLDMHWTCAVVNLRDQQLIYYDSMGGEEHEIMDSLAQYVRDEFKDKKKMDVDATQWKKLYPKNIPRQMNGYDCGVFTLQFAEFTARGAELTFSQADMEYYRMKVIMQLLQLHID